MQLDRYLNWLANSLDSRRDAQLEHFWVEYGEPARKALVEGRLRFWDGSLLKFVEVLEQRGAVLGKLEYVYHYQDGQAQLVFRYDNSPHHPEIDTFPHHKHVMTSDGKEELIEPAVAPTIRAVLQEVEQTLYPDAN